MNPDQEQRVDQVRRFNRLYTRRIGVIQDGYLDSPFSLAEVRVLYEVAHHPTTTASELGRCLDLDAGYLSRILRKFADRGLIDKTRSEPDGRKSHLSLTPSGQQTFEPLERAARAQIGSLLGRLPESRQRTLLKAMADIEGVLAEGSDPGEQYTLRTQPRPGDFGWVVQRHGAIYHAEYGWDMTFEALVASIVAKFVEHFDASCERVWIAERTADGAPLGCLFLVKSSRRVAKLRLFLVEPDARGMGIGRRMVDELIAFARDTGYHTIRLWTQSVLLAARHIYAEFGFKLIEQEPNHAFGADLISETWELRLS